MNSFKRRKALLLSSALAGALALGANSAVAQSTPPMPVYQFDIPAETLSKALKDFSVASSQQIVFSENDVGDRKVPALHGLYTSDQALAVLLAGSDLHVATSAAGVLMVRPKNVQAASNEAAMLNDIETVTVTGTHLRNTEALTPITTITAQKMIQQGYNTLADALAQLPQNSSAGVSANSEGFGEGAALNTTFANGVNLRGLGANDTLVLLNGRRLPPTALGNTVDISGIPISAISRVEILDDGASAIYGADAVAGVVNIITKTDFSGIETGARMYGAADGKQPNYGGYALGGYSWDSGNLIIDYDYQKENPLFASERSFTNTAPNPTPLSPTQETSTIYGTINQELTPDLQLSMDAIYSSRSFEENSLDPFIASTIADSGRSKQFSGSAELDYRAFSDWKFSLVGQLGTEADSNNPFYSAFAETTPQNDHYLVDSIEAQGDGTVVTLPGGDVKFAAGISYRHESFHELDLVCPTGSVCGTPTITDNHRGVFSAYGEVLLPVIGEDNRLPLVEQLRIDVAVRYDRYSDFGATTNPKATLQWVPVQNLSLHGSYSTAFKAPTLYAMGNQPEIGYVYFANGANSSGGDALEIQGAQNPNLRPETAVTFNGGASYKPDVVPGFSIDASYFDIHYKNKIEYPFTQFGFTNLIGQEGALGSFLNTSPSVTQINAALAAHQVTSYVGPFTPSDISIIANLGEQNAAVVDLDGLDLKAGYDFDSEIGHFTIDADGSYFLSDTQRLTPTSISSPAAGIVYMPVRFRGNLNAMWNLGNWAANARLNYTGSERNPNDLSCVVAQGCPVASWTTFDVATSYAFEGIPQARFLDGARINFSVANLFDRKPPFVNNIGIGGINYDPVNANPFGRTFAVAITKRW